MFSCQESVVLSFVPNYMFLWTKRVTPAGDNTLRTDRSTKKRLTTNIPTTRTAVAPDAAEASEDRLHSG